MKYRNTFKFGAQVKLSAHCPIDFESVGPLPGERGRIVAISGASADSGVAAVRFERISSPLIIPHRFLELID